MPPPVRVLMTRAAFDESKFTILLLCSTTALVTFAE